MISPVIEDGCIAIDGDHIVAVGPTREINPPHVDEEIDGILMPGLINVHTHLELTNVARPEPPGTFQNWLLTTIESMREADAAVFDRKRAEAAHGGIAQCLKFGVTCVGDISQNVDIVRPILAQGPIRSVSFGECLGLGERQNRFQALLAKAMTGSTADPNKLMSIGISPHAPYTVDIDGYREIESLLTPDIRATTHLAETPDELAFAARREGPFQAVYQSLGFDPGLGEPMFVTTMIAGLAMYGGLWLKRWLLAHVNYCSDVELDVLAKSDAKVVWCPRTHAYFGHPPHRWREMRERDIAVCVGTDSCASSPDLNLVDELRLLHAQYPEESPAALWMLVTCEAQRALRWGDADQTDRSIIGCLAPDALADFVSFPTQSADPLREILDTPEMFPNGVWVGGTRCH